MRRERRPLNLNRESITCRIAGKYLPTCNSNVRFFMLWIPVTEEQSTTSDPTKPATSPYNFFNLECAFPLPP